MKERPILFSGPMVRAIIEGRKTQTRRVVNLREFQPTSPSGAGWDWDFRDRRGRWNSYTTKQLVASTHNRYGGPGDRLWVREAIVRGPTIVNDSAFYEADDGQTALDTWPWKRQRLPGMFMPRGLSRIALEVTGVRVERLNDISEGDAIAEGISRTCEDHGCSRLCGCASCIEGGCVRATWAFANLWRDINGAESWGANPWVWVVEFTRAA